MNKQDTIKLLFFIYDTRYSRYSFLIVPFYVLHTIGELSICMVSLQFSNSDERPSLEPTATTIIILVINTVIV